MLPGCEVYMWDLIKRLPHAPFKYYQRSSADPEVILDSIVCQDACALACRVVAAFVVVFVSRRFARLGLPGPLQVHLRPCHEVRHWSLAVRGLGPLVTPWLGNLSSVGCID